MLGVRNWLALLALGFCVSGARGSDLVGTELVEQVEKLAQAGAIDFEENIVPILEKYCTDCHNEVDDEGNLDLEYMLDPKVAEGHPGLWERVAKTAEMDIMPPAKKKTRPEALERALLMGWGLQIGLRWDNEVMGTNPGRTTIRRLNKNEYNYTIRDLFGLKIRPADKFPEDSLGEGGFDNDADALFLPALLMENFLEAAAKVTEAIYASRELRETYLRNAGIDASAARKVFSYWTPRIYRRHVETEEVDRLVSVYEAARERGLSHQDAMRDPLIMMLVSPSFLYRSELPIAGGGKVVGLNDFELANRLSYFLWASMPDQELFRVASQKRLSEPEVLEEQVIRMLKDPKSRALSMHLGGQWFGWEKLRTTANPDTKKFPEFDFGLRVDLYRESVKFFGNLLEENGSLFDLIDSNYGFLNERLAKHYGVEGVEGKEFRRVEFLDPRRGGVLGMGSVLVATSKPMRTSPSVRGSFVLEYLLDDPPPSPPMDVEQLPADDQGLKTATFRETLDEHRDNPSCRACHALIDPLGFGLEGFDAIGRWRTESNGYPIDMTGTMPGGKSFAGPAELKALLMGQKKDFARNAAKKFLSYALGRELTPFDRPTTRKISEEVMADGGRIHTLVLGIVRSEAFLNRENPES
ncbi:MAG: DUF1592 domain-containing protein [Verrucomicrobiota bacterium]